MSDAPHITIDWPCGMVVASENTETAVSRVLHRRGEWGRGRDLPQHRQDEIAAVCDAKGMTLHQALSLRRSMLRSFPGGMARVNQSQSMGSAQGQQQVATLFEEAVVAYVRDCTRGMNGVFLTEDQLKKEMRAGRMSRGPTPDILFLRPVRINGRSVRWIDAKLYYASVMFGRNTRLPNGKLRDQAARFNQHYGGQGAFIFGQGFCADLTRIVTNALLLDATPLDMSAVNEFQDAS